MGSAGIIPASPAARHGHRGKPSACSKMQRALRNATAAGAWSQPATRFRASRDAAWQLRPRGLETFKNRAFPKKAVRPASGWTCKMFCGCPFGTADAFPWSVGEFRPRQNHVLQPTLKAGVFDLFRACGRLAPDPHSHGRMLLPGRRPRLYFLALPRRAGPAPPEPSRLQTRRRGLAGGAFLEGPSRGGLPGRASFPPPRAHRPTAPAQTGLFSRPT